MTGADGTDAGPVEADRDSRRVAVLGTLADVALAVAAGDEVAVPPVPAPGRIRGYLRFSHLPSAARRVVLDVLDSDEDFRHRVALAVEGDRSRWRLDEVASAFLSRPPGWIDVVGAAVDEAASRAVAESDAEEDRRAARRLEAVRARAGELHSQLESVRHDLEVARDEAAFSAQRIARLEEDLRSVSHAAEDLRDARRRAVAELKETERRLAERTAEVHDLERRLAAAPSATAAVPDPAESAALVAWRRAAQEDLERLAASLGELARRFAEPVYRHDAPAAAQRGAPVVRRPRRVGRGIAPGTVEEARVLVGTTGAVILVDGYNVSMSSWPRLGIGEQRAALESAAERLARAVGAEIHLLFDGDGPVNSTALRHGPALVRVRFTQEGREADDEILDSIGHVDTARPVVVVSSDRRVVDGARDRGANVLSATIFGELLRS